MVSIWEVNRQLPEAVERLERIDGEFVERIAKTEEQDVRLNMALSRLSAHEEKVQGCMDRVEHLPTLSQVRSMWREELRRWADKANFDGLGRSVHLQSQALEELAER